MLLLVAAAALGSNQIEGKKEGGGQRASSR